MGDKQKGLVSELIGCSWAPLTPAEPICTEWQDNQGFHTNGLKSEKIWQVNQISEGFLQENPAACWNSANALDTREADITAKSQVNSDDLCRNSFSVNEKGMGSRVSFGELLALADAAGNNASAQTAFNVTSSSFVPNLQNTIDGRQCTISFENSPLANLDTFLDESNSIQNISNDGRCIHSRPFFDLNFPSRTADSTFSEVVSSQFAPITPEKTARTDERWGLAMPNVSRDEMLGTQDVQQKEIAIKRVELEGFLQTKEQSQLAVDHICEIMSTRLEENHKPDNGGIEDVDLSKTPQLKPRRKKHRPKVMTKGKSQITPKPSVGRPSDPQETTRVKRKYVRRKAVNNPTTDTPLEREINGTDTNTNAPSSKETMTGEKKYVKRKGVNKPAATDPDQETCEITDPKTVQHPRKICRRSLDFDIEGQVRDENSHLHPSPNFDMESQAQNFNAKDQSRSTTQCIQGREASMKKSEVNIAYDLTCSMKQVMKGYLSKPEGHSSCPSPHSKTDALHDKSTLADQKVGTRGKCQIIFSDFTHDEEGNTVQVIKNSDAGLIQKCQSDSVSSSTACLTKVTQEKGLKRQHWSTTVEAEFSRSNSTGTLHNSLQAYSALFPQYADNSDCTPGMHFPAMYCTKRIEKGHNSVTSSMHSTIIASENREVAAADGTQNEQKNLKFLSALGTSERLQNRSKGTAPIWNLESPLEISGQLPASPCSVATTSKTAKGFEILHQPRKKRRSKGPAQDPKALIVGTNATMMTKNRPKKSLLINSTVQNIHSDHQLAARSMGTSLAITRMCKSPVDAIIEKFNELDLNAKSSEEHNAFISYHTNYQEQHALVPYQRNGALIPFDSSFHQVKRRRSRPKVDLDDETSRVWKLLLENIYNEGIDGTDEEKEKWWAEERRTFCGRADSFIARMHLVQGDRRFSPWKGSVLDSVIGVFLTQNVSDHLSSSAFMSLAARFPFESESNQGQSCQERVNIAVKEPEVHNPDTEDKFGSSERLNKPTCSKDSKMLQVSDYNDVREVNSVEYPEDSCIVTITKDSLSHQLSAVSKNSADISHESAVNRSIGFIADERELDDTLSSQNSCSQNSADSIIAQSAETTESCLPRTLEAEAASGRKPNSIFCSTSNLKLPQMSWTILNEAQNQGNGNKSCSMDGQIEPERMASDSQNQSENQSDITCSEPALRPKPSSGTQVAECFDLPQQNGKSSNITIAKEPCDTELSGLSTESATQATIQKFLAISREEVPKFNSEKVHSINNCQIGMYQKVAENPTGKLESQFHFQENNSTMQEVSNITMFPQNLTDITGSSNIDNLRIPEHKEIGSNLKIPGKTASEPKAKGGRIRKEKQKPVNWDSLRKQAQEGGRRRERTANKMDSVDWEAVRCADVKEIAETIKERGMNNVLAERIQEFLNRLVTDHGSIDLEWLREVPPDKAKEYLLSVRGLGLKSVECVRLLTLHHLAFPVDTNVGRIAVRLGWVPLQPLPESLQLHLLELYPVLESIQKYLWPRLCKLDQRTLYELHYQMITFGKVFCTKSKPNCNACPMRGECRHFASAFASARLALPGTEEKSIMSATENNTAEQNPVKIINPLQLPLPQANQLEGHAEASNSEPIIEVPSTPEPVIEMPTTPESDQTQVPECDIEDNDFTDYIPTIQLNMKEFADNLQAIMQNQMELQEGDMSKALVALTPEAASIPMPKLKNVSRLRTEHQVYVLPDSHPLLQRMDKREPDDPCSYLLAIWTPGETAESTQPPERQCTTHESGSLCTNETCFSCNSIREGNSQTVRGTLLIPCRTAMRGSFPLNGTYFQVNEVFADHESSLNPINVPRDWLWNLPRRTVYFGTSIPSIFKGLSTEGIQHCFWRGFVCVRGFDWKTRAPRPLIARLHFPASKVTKVK